MDCLNEAVSVARHHQEIAGSIRTRIPVRVRSALRHQNSGTGTSLHNLIPALNAKYTLEHVPGFIVLAVQMKRCDVARRSGRPSGILPLGDDEIAFGGADYLS